MTPGHAAIAYDPLPIEFFVDIGMDENLCDLSYQEREYAGQQELIMKDIYHPLQHIFPPLVEANDFIGESIDEGCEILTESAGNMQEPQHRLVPEIVCPLFVKAAAVGPHLLQNSIRLAGFIQTGILGRDGKHHKQLMLQILFQLRLRDVIQVEGSKAFSKDLMKKYNIPTAAYETSAA